MAWSGHNKKPLPGVGEAFLVPLAKGASTFCWVVRHYQTRSVYGGKKLGDYEMDEIVIACARWTGKGRPTAQDLAAPEVRDAYDVFSADLKRLGWLALVSADPPPKTWAKLGKVGRAAISVPLLPGGKTTFPDGRVELNPSFAGFAGLAQHAQRAWKLMADPEKQLALEAAEAARDDAANAADDAELTAQVEQRRRATLAQLAKLELLPEWDGLTSTRHRTAVTKLLVACVAELRAMPKAKRPAKLAVIAATVERINAWNDRNEVIDTAEREALCTAIDDIGRAAGLRGHDLAGPSRDW